MIQEFKSTHRPLQRDLKSNEKSPQPFTSNNEYGSKFLSWSSVAFKPTGIIRQCIYCYVALSFIAGETNFHVLKFLLKSFTFSRTLNNNITFQIIFFFQVSAMGLNTTHFFLSWRSVKILWVRYKFLDTVFFLSAPNVYVYLFFLQTPPCYTSQEKTRQAGVSCYLSVLVSLSSLFVADTSKAHNIHRYISCRISGGVWHSRCCKF